MKLLYRTGCTVTSLEVNGKQFNLELTEEQRRKVCRKIVKECDDCFLQEIFISFLEQCGKPSGEGDSGYLYTCDECGDAVYEWTINI